MTNYEDIRPLNDAETVDALRRVSGNPVLPFISKYLFPDEKRGYLRRAFLAVDGVDSFQREVMSRVVSSVMEKTSDGFTCEGLEGLDPNVRFLAVSNHRDIVMDTALMQWALFEAGFPLTEICVGNNLLSGGIVNTLLRVNRMITVRRDVAARELYNASVTLSSYIRDAVTSGRSSVWIAQREGRAKDGCDRTAQAVLKMLALSGSGEFVPDFDSLHIVPMSISYEYESCDYLRTRELYLRRQGPYTKKHLEDTRSILTGIRQQKGHVHLTLGTQLTEEELVSASKGGRNERLQALMALLDRKIISGYKLWKTNYMGYDLMTGGTKYAERYNPEDLAEFRDYIERQLDKIEKRLDRDALHDILLHIYGNPVAAKESL